MGEKRFILLFLVLILVGGVAAAAWVASSRIVSPAEAAARTAPPEPSPILVPVEKRVLSTRVITRGTGRFGLPQPVSLVPSTLKPSASLLTTLPLRNTQFQEGDVMLTASGRPVFVLQGAVPAFRDLVPGISGKDVRQLEEALARLGFDPGPVDGTYDEKTSSAVEAWYEGAGWEPFWPTPAQIANVRTLEESLGIATRDHLAATLAVATATQAVEIARAKAQHAYKLANADIQAGIAERAVIVLDPRGLASARSAADAKIEVGRAALKAATLEGEAAYQAAQEALKIAELDAKLAADRVDRLATDVEAAKSKLGTQIPLDEIVFLPTLPVRVKEVTALIGDPASGPLMAVTDNQLAIDGALTLEAARLVKPGMEVNIDEQALGIKAKGVVEQVADTPGTHGVDGYHIYFVVRVLETTSPLEGFSLRMVIPIESTKQAVTVVPISALSLAADGTSRVQVQRDGVLEDVVVEPGLRADGFVEVMPISGTLKAGDRVVVGRENNLSAYESTSLRP